MTDEPREEGFYWVILGQNPPEIAYWERGPWWLAGDAKPWRPEAMTVLSGRLVFRPQLVPAAPTTNRAPGDGRLFLSEILQPCRPVAANGRARGSGTSRSR